MSAFREEGQEAAIYRTIATNTEGQTEWKHATKKEWDCSSEFRREILIINGKTTFVVKA